MRTTLDLPDDLMRAVRVRAAQDNRRLKDAIAGLLERGLALPQKTGRRTRRRVQLPLVECARRASPKREMTPERVARVLLDQER